MDQVYVGKGEEYNGRYIREAECPHCGSRDVATLDQGIEDDIYFYEMQCNKCAGEWTDHYTMTFSSMYIIQKETDQ